MLSKILSFHNPEINANGSISEIIAKLRIDSDDVVEEIGSTHKGCGQKPRMRRILPS